MCRYSLFAILITIFVIFKIYVNNKGTVGSATSSGVVYTVIANYSLYWRNRVAKAASVV